MSALMIAATRGLIDEVKNLIALSADPQLIGGLNRTAAQWAIEMQQMQVADYLNLIEQQNKIQMAQPCNAPLNAANRILLETYQNKQAKEIDVDHDLLFSLIRSIHRKYDTGSILIFLPGYDSIVEQNERISTAIEENQIEANIRVLMLHSNMQASDQKQVFAAVERGCRKIILSTNIAETSLTIDDVVFVIDCGKVKQKSFDAMTGATSLTSTWISQACAKQRMGRAGRVRPGLCFRMYSRLRYSNMDAFTLPEMLRVPLTEISLNAKILAGNETSIASFLARAIQPPASVSVTQSVKLLKLIGALDMSENITKLGMHLVDLPVDVQLGKTLLYAVMMKCLDPVLTIVSALSVKDPFVLPALGDSALTKQSRNEFAEDSCSDHMILLRVFQRWNEAKANHRDRQFCRDNCISNGSMQMICGVRSQILGHLRSSGLIQHRAAGNIHELNKHSTNWAVIKACMTAGLYPNICRIDRLVGRLSSRQENKLIPHPTSVLRDKNPKKCEDNLRALPTDWLIFGEKSRAGRMCLVRHTTVVTPLNIALFSGPVYMPYDRLQMVEQNDSDSDSDHDEDGDDGADKAAPQMRYIIDDWIEFVVPMEMAIVVHQMRQKLNAIMLKIVHDPVKYYSHTDCLCIDLIAQMLLADDASFLMAQPKDVGRRPISVKLNLGAHLNFGVPDQSFGDRMQQHREQQEQPNSSNRMRGAREFKNQNRYEKQQRKHGPETEMQKSSTDPQNWRRTHMVGSVSRFFIVKCGSEDQVRRLISGGKWTFNSMLFNRLKEIKRVSL